MTMFDHEGVGQIFRKSDHVVYGCPLTDNGTLKVPYLNGLNPGVLKFLAQKYDKGVFKLESSHKLFIYFFGRACSKINITYVNNSVWLLITNHNKNITKPAKQDLILIKDLKIAFLAKMKIVLIKMVFSQKLSSQKFFIFYVKKSVGTFWRKKMFPTNNKFLQNFRT